jgi:hypothetical protein
MSNIIKFPRPYKTRAADDEMTPEDWHRYLQQIRERRKARQRAERTEQEKRA